jgi:hypothetical protein
MDVRLAHIYEIKMMLAGARDLHRRVSIPAGPKTLSNQSQSQPHPRRIYLHHPPLQEINCARCVKGKANKTVRLLRRQSARAARRLLILALPVHGG